MKKLAIALALVLKISGAEPKDTIMEDRKPELNYFERINYIDPEQFTQNVKLLLNDEKNKEIAACLLYLSHQISDLRFRLNGHGSELGAINKQISLIETILQSLKNSFKLF